MRFDAILLIIATALSICFCRYAYTKLWDLGKKGRLYCIFVFAFTVLCLLVGWLIANQQGILTLQ